MRSCAALPDCVRQNSRWSVVSIARATGESAGVAISIAPLPSSLARRITFGVCSPQYINWLIGSTTIPLVNRPIGESTACWLLPSVPIALIAPRSVQYRLLTCAAGVAVAGSRVGVSVGVGVAAFTPTRRLRVLVLGGGAGAAKRTPARVGRRAREPGFTVTRAVNTPRAPNGKSLSARG